MRPWLLSCALAATTALTAPAAAAPADTPEAALACAAARYRGEALSIRWEPGEQRWDLRWLTPARSVLRLRIAPGCRWREVHGVGQEAARIAPPATAPVSR